MIIRFSTFTLALVCIATWLLVHPYQGIFHDANLYTLQAMAHVLPNSLSRDVFLQFGSQDRFTLFSPVYATSIRLLGVDHAAALLTFISQVGLVLSAGCIARAVMPAKYALLGLIIFVAAPGDYGPGGVFTTIEPFVTPRMGAEALTLAAIAANFSALRFRCFALLGFAFVLHPVMAAAGAVYLAVAHVLLPRPRWAALLSLGVGACLLVASFVFPTEGWGRLDVDWLTLAAHRSPFLFLFSWQTDDWSRAAVTLTILIAGSVTLDSKPRLLCRASALTMTGGLLVTWLTCDCLHLTLFTQMQPWRWQWLGSIAAALSLPLIASVNWNRSAAGRVTSVLLASAWIYGVSAFAITACLAVLLSLSFDRLKDRELQFVAWGSYAVLTLALLWRVASNLEFTDMHYMDPLLPKWLRRATSFAHDGFGPALLACCVAWLTRAPRALIGSALSTTIVTAAIITLSPFAWAAWTKKEFPQEQIERFAGWREIIAPGDDVFWGESPLSSWVLLNRPNYISAVQTAGMIFSRPSALEMERRALSLREAIDPQTFLHWARTSGHLALTSDQLRSICSTQSFDYLVTHVDIGLQPVAILDNLKLYRCTPQARAAAAAT